MILKKTGWIFVSLVALTLLLTACEAFEPETIAVVPTATEVAETVDTPTPLPTETPAPTPEEAMEAAAEAEEAMEAPAEPDDETAAQELWQEMQEAQYAQNWQTTGKGTLYPGQPPHGALLSLYLSPEAAEAMEGQPGEMPDGAVVVKENYNPEEELVSITVMQKRADYAPEYGNWFWVAYGPDGSVQNSGQIESCIACHGAAQSNDYIFTFPIAPIEVAEMEATDEDMTVAEELWQEMQEAQYAQNWQTTAKGTLYPGLEPHGALVSVFLSPEAAEGMEGQPGQMPDGAVVVKENYGPEEELASLTVMQKRAGYAPEYGDWFWVAYAPDGSIQRSGQLAGCIACHGAMQSNDYIFTFPVAPIQVGEMGMQPEATETPMPAEEEAQMEEAAANMVEVGLTEYEINMPNTLPPGPTTFEVTNTGSIIHNFEIEGQGIEEVFETNLQSGETRTMEVDLQPGTYEVYCPVGNHAEQGMRLELIVSDQ